MLAVGVYTPDCDFKREVLRAGLADRSKTVRLQAIRAANLALVPDLRQRRESETDCELQRLIDEQVQFLTGEYVVDPDPGSVKSHSFYRRVENSIQHFVVNYVLENRWLQLEVVPHAGGSVDPCTPIWFASPPVARGVKARLDPQRVIRAVLAGIAAENAEQGTDFVPSEIRFAQTDFDCYDLYCEAVRLLTRQIAAGGPWLELMIVGPGR